MALPRLPSVKEHLGRGGERKRKRKRIGGKGRWDEQEENLARYISTCFFIKKKRRTQKKQRDTS